MLAVCPAYAQPSEEIARLRAILKTQQALNERLLERVDALEARQTEVLEKLDAVAASVPDPEAQEAMLEELRAEYLDLQDRLDLLPTVSGYYDFEYLNDDRSDSPGEFRQHHLSLHLSKEWERWRLFSEIEFEFGTLFEGDGETVEASRGELKLEQAWGEYVHSDGLTLRGGLILTPGYWNVNHYPNVVLSTSRPLLVRKVFREAFVGIMAYGSKYWDGFGVTYNGYVGNGQSVFFTKEDDNEGKAVGGKVTLHVPTRDAMDTLDVGLSAYHESPSGEDRVFTWGVDTQMRHGPWEVLGEFAQKEGSVDRTGLYMQPSYRFNERWAAFYRYDLLMIDHDGEVQGHTLGVNYRPIPDVSLKLEYSYSRASDGEDFSGVAASVAIHF